MKCKIIKKLFPPPLPRPLPPTTHPSSLRKARAAVPVSVMLGYTERQYFGLVFGGKVIMINDSQI